MAQTALLWSAALVALAHGPLGVVALRTILENWAGLTCLVPEDSETAPRALLPTRATRPQGCDGLGDLAAYLGTKALPLDKSIWQGTEFLPKRTDFERALRPAGYAGARFRLRKFLLQLLAGKPVVASVLGGSMTLGPWSHRLEELAKALGHKLTVHNLAKAATGSEYAATHLLFERHELNSSGLIIVDTSINDWADWYQRTGRYGQSRYGSKDSYDLLVEELLKLPHRPAVIELATFSLDGPHHSWPHTHNHCAESVGDFPHARAEVFQLPIVSFEDAMCQCCGAHGLWFGNLHPNITTHDAIARTLVASFGLEMEEACKPGGLQVPDHPPSSRGLRQLPFSECLRTSSRTHVDFTACASAEEGAQYVQEQDGWEFGRDLPTKPYGWLLPRNSPPGKTIDLKLNASSGGWIRLDYLSTYENIGSVTCWVDGVSPGKGCLINAFQQADFSAVRSAYIGLPNDLEAQLLHCRSNGGKFKLMGIDSC